MLIKHKNHVINLDKVAEFKESYAIEIIFYFSSEGSTRFTFNSEEERDKAFKFILESVYMKVRVCYLE